MGVHAIDTGRFVLGDPLPERVCAAIGTRYGSYDVDDDAILLVGWSNGTNSVIESGWWHPHTEGMEADTEVYGTKGYARIFPREAPSDQILANADQRLTQLVNGTRSVGSGFDHFGHAGAFGGGAPELPGSAAA